jgi:O-antigen/teichoic acid export membrane protein
MAVTHDPVAAVASVRERGSLSVRGAIAATLASGLVGQAALLVTGIAAARMLGPTERGYLAYVILVPTVFLSAGNLGLPLAATYAIARAPGSTAQVARLLRRPFLAQILVLTPLAGLALWVTLDDAAPRRSLVILAVLPLVAGGLGDIYGRAIVQGQQRFGAFNVLRNTVVAVYLVGVLVLLASGTASLAGFVVAWTIANLAAGAAALGVAVGRRARRDPAARTTVTRRQLWSYGLRGYVASTSPIQTFRLDQALIALVLPPAALGYYVAALAFTNLPQLVARGFGMVALPHLAGTQTSDQATVERRFVAYGVVATTITVVVLELTAGVLVPLAFGDEFTDAITLARILLLGSLFYSIGRILADAAAGRGRPGIGSIAEVSSWIVAAVGLVTLTPLAGAEGAATAMALASLAGLVAMLVLRRTGGTPAPAANQS